MVDAIKVSGEGFRFPLAGGERLRQTLGQPRSYRGEGKVHAGIDIKTPIGSPIFSIGEGRVYAIYKDWEPGSKHHPGGNLIIVEYPGKLFAMYCHLSEVDVKPGDSVQPGTFLGLTGVSGGKPDNDASISPNVDGAHLHFELHQDGPPKRGEGGGQLIDPYYFLTTLVAASGWDPGPYASNLSANFSDASGAETLVPITDPQVKEGLKHLHRPHDLGSPAGVGGNDPPANLQDDLPGGEIFMLDDPGDPVPDLQADDGASAHEPAGDTVALVLDIPAEVGGDLHGFDDVDLGVGAAPPETVDGMTFYDTDGLGADHHGADGGGYVDPGNIDFA